MSSASLPSATNISDTSSNEVSMILNKVAFTFNVDDIDVDGVGVVGNFKPGRPKGTAQLSQKTKSNKFAQAVTMAADAWSAAKTSGKNTRSTFEKYIKRDRGRV